MKTNLRFVLLLFAIFPVVSSSSATLKWTFTIPGDGNPGVLQLLADEGGGAAALYELQDNRYGVVWVGRTGQSLYQSQLFTGADEGFPLIIGVSRGGLLYTQNANGILSEVAVDKNGTESSVPAGQFQFPLPNLSYTDKYGFFLVNGATITRYDY